MSETSHDDPSLGGGSSESLSPALRKIVGRRIRSAGVEVCLAVGRRGKSKDSHDLNLLMLVGGKPYGPSIRVSIHSRTRDVPTASEAGAETTVPLLHFPGKSRHPAGSDAPLSWFNDEGEGWIKVLAPGRTLFLPLLGWVADLEDQVVPTRGRRGPPKAMDLWLSIAALLAPSSINGVRLQRMTGINSFNVYDWLSRSSALGLIARVPGSVARREQFLLPPDQVEVLAERIRLEWQDWSAGRTTARLRPLRRYFVATGEWPAFQAIGGEAVLATGVTWLEGRDGGPARLTSGGSIPRLSCMCRASALDQLVVQARITPQERRERPYDSEVLILADEHPLWLLRERIRPAPGGDPVDWPGGLRVLDALQDSEPRVREAAERAWRDWVETRGQVLTSYLDHANES